MRANRASAKLAEARQAGAERTALYEYTLAQEHLAKAMTEAAEADYGDAYELAGLADDYAEVAADKARRRLRANVTRGSAGTQAAAPDSPPQTEVRDAATHDVTGDGK